jgi:hypothetical protein
VPNVICVCMFVRIQRACDKKVQPYSRRRKSLPGCVASNDIWNRDVVAHSGPHKKVQGHPKVNGEGYARSYAARSNQK